LINEDSVTIDSTQSWMKQGVKANVWHLSHLSQTYLRSKKMFQLFLENIFIYSNFPSFCYWLYISEVGQAFFSPLDPIQPIQTSVTFNIIFKTLFLKCYTLGYVFLNEQPPATKEKEKVHLL